MGKIKNFEEFTSNDSEQTNEKKKMNAGLRAYLDKKNGKKKDEDEDEEKDEKDTKKKGEDDGDDDEEEEKESKKGLTAKQKKLPEALQKAILAKQNKK